MPHVQTTKLFLVNRETMKRYCISGLKNSSKKSRHKSLRKKFTDHIVYARDRLPPKVDLRHWMTPVEDQSDLNACTANAVAGIYEYLIKKSTNNHIDVSRLFIYYNARKKEREKENLPLEIIDEGATITSTIDTLKELGTCSESKWPYLKAIVNEKPTRKIYSEAKESTITEALEVPVDLYYMKSCLAQGFPFLFGLQLYQSFHKAEYNGGVVLTPKSSMAAHATHGSHAMLAVGYSEASQAFIVRNSWGEDWGDDGYCYIPYEYMTNKDLCSDVWTVKITSGDTLGTEQWSMQDTQNYLVHNPALGPQAYTDDNRGASIEEIVVRDRVSHSTHSQRHDGAPNANNAAPPSANNGPRPNPSPSANNAASPFANSGARPMADSNASPFRNYGSPPMPNSNRYPFSNYPPPSMPNYPPPPMPSYPPFPFPNYPPPPMPNYPSPPMPNYPPFPFQNYPPFPFPNPPIFPPRNHTVPNITPYSNFRRRTSLPQQRCDNQDRRQGLWERLFLKP